jgi:transposase-like protein
MPDKTACPRCAVIGFVRVENVIKGTNAERRYFCGACAYEWSVADPGTTQRDSTPPERAKR